VTSQRQQQVGHLLREEISRIIHQEMRDPRLGFVTLTEVEVTPDLRLARIFVSVYGDQAERDASLEALAHASGFIRSELAKGWTLRYLPELEFRWDPSVERAARITELLHQVLPPNEPKDDQTSG